MMKNEVNKGNAFALLPIGIFLLLFIGSGIITGDFYKMPALVAFIVAAGVALLFNKKTSFQTKVDVFCKGAGEPNIILMAIIFLLAGSFGSVAKAMGGVELNSKLKFINVTAKSFSCRTVYNWMFISVSMGTSVGTIAALAPIGLGISERSRDTVALVTAAIVEVLCLVIIYL